MNQSSCGTFRREKYYGIAIRFVGHDNDFAVTQLRPQHLVNAEIRGIQVSRRADFSLDFTHVPAGVEKEVEIFR